MGKITRNERSELGIVGWLKAIARGGTQVRVVAVDRCQACGECVRVCPEHAITLRRVVSPSSLEM
jgi:ferredoxin